MTVATEARRAWRALLDSHKPVTREERLRLVGLLSLEYRAAVLAERSEKIRLSLDDPHTICYIYVHED